MQTAERVSKNDPSDNFVFQRSLLAYFKAAELVSGTVLEIGTGSGYGMEIISPKADRFITVDKFRAEQTLSQQYGNVEFRQMTVPPLRGIDNESVDFVVSFQVIEHIQNDREFVAECHRVLRKGGSLILSTPNRLMSLTRNPWHVREYVADELKGLLSGVFDSVEQYGVLGNQKVMDYYEQNRRSVERFARFDLFDLQHRLPRQLLQLPYDVLNRINRRKLLNSNSQLTRSIEMSDYSIGNVFDRCFDLYYIAKKR